MFQLEVWQAPITDNQGNILPGAQITVFNSDDTVSTIYDDLDRAPKANPFNVGTDALARFYAEPGRYRVQAQSGTDIAVYDNVDLSQKAYRYDLAAPDSEALIAGRLAKDVSSLREDLAQMGSEALISGVEAKELARLNELPIAGTFETGFTITDKGQFAIFKGAESDAPYLLRWGGGLPKEVPPGSSPGNTGGFGGESWVDAGGAARAAEEQANRAELEANRSTTEANRAELEANQVEASAEAIAASAAESATQTATAEANRAEGAAEAAMSAGWVYPSTSAGEAARSNGDYFWVVGSADSDVLGLRRMVSNTEAVDTGKRTVTSHSVRDKFQDLGVIPTVRGKATREGSGTVFDNIADYESSSYVPVNEGDVIYYTGVASTTTPVKAFNEKKEWVSDLFAASATRVLVYRQPITIPAGVSYIIASSAVDDTSSSGPYPTSRLALDGANPVGRNSDASARSLQKILTETLVLAGTDGPYAENVDYEASPYISVKEGDIITYTGVASTTNPIKGFDSNASWVQDLFTPSATREYTYQRTVVVPAGISYITACSAVNNTAGTQFAKSRLILLVNGKDALKNMTVEARVQESELEQSSYEMRGSLINGEALMTGGEPFFDSAATYHRTGLLPVIEGEVIKYTGVASPVNGAVKAFNENQEWVSDLLVPSEVRELIQDRSFTVPSGVKYIMACSSYLPQQSFPYIPLMLKRSFSVINEIIEFEGGGGTQTQPETLTTFRTMAYNIYEGGRNSVGREAVIKHISRTYPDILSVQEAGDVSVLRPLLEQQGFKYFYGPGGTFGMYFASKYPITFAQTFTSVDWARNPLYTELDINGKTVGVVSIHLDSSCTGLCHDPDFLNVAPQEPAAQRRAIQMYQIMAELNSRKAQNPNLSGFIVQGDYNAIHNEANVIEYTSAIDETSLPAGLSYPLANAQFPFKQFEFYDGSMTLDTTPALNGDTYTWWGPPESPNPVEDNFPHRLDYIAYSDSIVRDKSEILNSIADNLTPDSGVKKYSESLNTDDGYIASDHIPVVADFIIP